MKTVMNCEGERLMASLGMRSRKVGKWFNFFIFRLDTILKCALCLQPRRFIGTVKISLKLCTHSNWKRSKLLIQLIGFCIQFKLVATSSPKPGQKVADWTLNTWGIIRGCPWKQSPPTRPYRISFRTLAMTWLLTGQVLHTVKSQPILNK